jgi:hypothetical protein
MELLIPGLILVALMIYASTRIKRSAAAAFDAETIETDDFIIQKPDGFLNVIGGDPQYAFEAYSKEFGGLDENIRMGQAQLTVRPGVSIDEGVTDIEGEVVSDIGEVISERHYRAVEAKRVVRGVDFRVFHKLAEKDGKLYDFETTVFVEAPEDFLNKAEAMLTSFELK